MVAKSGAEPVEWGEVTNYMRAFVESEFFLGKSKSLPSMDHLKTEKEAVKFALGFEKETLLYFMELRKIVKEKRGHRRGHQRGEKPHHVARGVQERLERETII